MNWKKSLFNITKILNIFLIFGLILLFIGYMIFSGDLGLAKLGYIVIIPVIISMLCFSTISLWFEKTGGILLVVLFLILSAQLGWGHDLFGGAPYTLNYCLKIMFFTSFVLGILSLIIGFMKLNYKLTDVPVVKNIISRIDIPNSGNIGFFIIMVTIVSFVIFTISLLPNSRGSGEAILLICFILYFIGFILCLNSLSKSKNDKEINKKILPIIGVIILPSIFVAFLLLLFGGFFRS